ncbi:MAG TPA: hypothetical protein VIA10_01310 [Gaiellaceae bacterium]|jgi:hypothetical protein
MRRLLALGAVVGGAALVLHRRGARREHVDLYYADGSMVTLERASAETERLLGIARAALS